MSASEDPKPLIEEECLSHHCESLKERLDSCAAKFEEGKEENCVEEFFDMMECINHCVSVLSAAVVLHVLTHRRLRPSCLRHFLSRMNEKRLMAQKPFVRGHAHSHSLPQNFMSIPLQIVSAASAPIQLPFDSRGAAHNDRKLYVGNIDMAASEGTLSDLFMPFGDIVSLKIINERSVRGHHVCNYGFVEFKDRQSAEHVIMQMQGYKLLSRELRLNWAVQNSHRNDFTNHHHIFVGDLGPGVTDQILAKAFSMFGSMSEARVMWDTTSGKSRGYGFVAFRQYEDAERAIAQMNGEWLGNRPIRCNWANQRSQPQKVSQPLPFGTVASQSSPYNSTVYIGNLPRGTTQQQVSRLFQGFGYIAEVRAFPEKGYAFVRLDNHQNASIAIASLHGTTFNGRELKCSWGRDRNQATTNDSYYTQTTGMPYNYPVQYAYYPHSQFVLSRESGATNEIDSRPSAAMHSADVQTITMMPSHLQQPQAALQLAWGAQQQSTSADHQQSTQHTDALAHVHAHQHQPSHASIQQSSIIPDQHHVS